MCADLDQRLQDVVASAIVHDLVHRQLQLWMALVGDRVRMVYNLESALQLEQKLCRAQCKPRPTVHEDCSPKTATPSQLVNDDVDQ